MLKIYFILGFPLFFSGMLINALWSKDWGATVSIFGFMFTALSFAFTLMLKTEGPYLVFNKIFSIFWLGTVIYHTPDILASPFLVSTWFVFAAYIIVCTTFLYIILFSNKKLTVT